MSKYKFYCSDIQILLQRYIILNSVIFYLLHLFICNTL